MFTAIIAYLVTAFAVNFMSNPIYVIPFFGRFLILSNPIASFLWPLGLLLHMTNNLFGLFKTQTLEEFEEDVKKDEKDK